jgi:hypothetical protein
MLPRRQWASWSEIETRLWTQRAGRLSSETISWNGPDFPSGWPSRVSATNISPL